MNDIVAILELFITFAQLKESKKYPQNSKYSALTVQFMNEG